MSGGVFGPKPQLARCPKCREFIDSSVRVCRFCKAEISPEEMLSAATEQTRITGETSRRNNKLATRAAIGSLIFSVIAFPIMLAANGIFVIHWGESITKLADLPSRDVRLGFVYKSFGVMFLDLWTWDGRYCLYKGKQFVPLGPKGVESVVLPNRPFFYRFPSGIVVLAVLCSGAILLIGVARMTRKREPPSTA